MINFLKDNLVSFLIILPVLFFITVKVDKIIRKAFFKLTKQKVDGISGILLFNGLFVLVDKIFNLLLGRKKS